MSDQHIPACSNSCCLKVLNLGVSINEQTILHDVNFHLHCREIAALIGPNGAGKSTLFKSILGQMPHTGIIDFQHADGTKMKPIIGYVPQSPSFDRGDPMSVQDFFAASISRWPVFLPTPKSLRKKIIEQLERVRAGSLIDKTIGTLSGGELQRVLLALALDPMPHILILDEPLSGVDIEGERQLLDLLLEVREQYDLSILFCTHDFAMLDAFCDKAILLKGTVLADGTPTDVLTSQPFQDVFHLSIQRGWSQ